MSCRSYAIKTTKPGGVVEYELKCYGKCTNGKPCGIDYFNPDQSTERIYRACFCQEEVLCGAPICNPSFESAGKSELKGCRVALVHGFKSDGTIEENPVGIECIGTCEKETHKCELIEHGATEFDGIIIQIYGCRCK